MGESKVKRENHLIIQGFMLTDLKLKGNELLIYACIFGFSQVENQVFTGSLQYLADWTNSTKQGVIKCLKSLEEKGHIVKKENFINGVKFCEYYATKFNTPLNKVEYPIKQSLPNNIDKNIDDNIGNNIFIAEIVDYLNGKIGAHYRTETNSTKRHITARLNEGYTVEDFKTVIDKKTAEWKGTEMEQYLRPETLFGQKFENYLNAKTSKPKTGNKLGVVL